MQTISLENWSELENLERAFYEKQSYENLLSYMAENNLSNYENYFNEYIKVIKTYSQLCKKLEQEVIFPETLQPIAWEVNFNEKYVLIRKTSN